MQRSLKLILTRITMQYLPNTKNSLPLHFLMTFKKILSFKERLLTSVICLLCTALLFLSLVILTLRAYILALLGSNFRIKENIVALHINMVDIIANKRREVRST
jgi:hypothetical protein